MHGWTDPVKMVKRLHVPSVSTIVSGLFDFSSISPSFVILWPGYLADIERFLHLRYFRYFACTLMRFRNSRSLERRVRVKFSERTCGLSFDRACGAIQSR